MLPQRPRQHEHEDEARRAFESRLPSAWTYTPSLGREYGIDGTVEIFEHGRATGLRFHVQLKGTDAANGRSALDVRVKIETFQYWRSLDAPVLIVLHKAASPQLYVAWTHRFAPEWLEEQQTLTLRLEATDEWDDETCDWILGEVEAFKLWRIGNVLAPVPVYVTSLPDGFSIGKIRSSLEGSNRVLDLRPGPAPPGAPRLEAGPEQIVFRIGDVASTTLTLPIETFGGRLHHLLAVTVAVTLHRAGASSIAARLLADHGIESGLLRETEFALEAVSICVAAERTAVLTNLIVGVARDLDDDVALSLLMALAPPLSSAELDEIEMALRNRLAARADTRSRRSRAPEHYSLANFLQSRGKWQEAIKEYVEAAQADGAYQHRSYWNQELAACYFEVGRYTDSVRHYRRALEQGDDVAVLPRLADAELHCGRYDVARALLDRYSVATGGDIEPWWQMKSVLVQQIIDMTGEMEQDRIPARRQHQHDVRGDPAELLAEGMALLSVDALNHHAWVVVASSKRILDHPDAVDAALAAAVSDQECIRSWTIALVSSMKVDPETGWVVFQAAYRYFEDDLLDDIGDYVDDASAIRDSIENMAASVRANWAQTGREVKLRSIDEAGEVHEVRIGLDR